MEERTERRTKKKLKKTFNEAVDLSSLPRHCSPLIVHTLLLLLQGTAHGPCLPHKVKSGAAMLCIVYIMG